MDGSCALSLRPVSVDHMASLLHTTVDTDDLLLIDIRPTGQFRGGHIRLAENVNFSNILLRRLLKGVVKLESMLTSPELVERVCKRRHTTQLVLCDSGSTSTACRPELLKHAEVFVNCLRDKDAKEGLQLGYLVQYIDGGFSIFFQQYPELTEQSSISMSPTSHVQISVSASLPISLNSGMKRKLKLRSAPADDSDRYGPPVEILPHLILGCAKDSSDLKTLQHLGVTAVLNVSHNCPSLFQSHFQYMEIRVPDTYQADLLSRLDEAFTFIDDVRATGGRVLVHCHAGVSRSATVCMAYVMKNMNYDLRTAYDFVKMKRSCVSPNLHFMGQLLEFERRLGAHTASTDDVVTLSSVQEEEHERPCSLPPSWISKEKRRAVSTPASLELCPFASTPKLATITQSLSASTTTNNSSSLPCTPLRPLPPPASTTIPHSSCSLQSLVLHTKHTNHIINTVNTQNASFTHRHVTESL